MVFRRARIGVRRRVLYAFPPRAERMVPGVDDYGGYRRVEPVCGHQGVLSAGGDDGAAPVLRRGACRGGSGGGRGRAGRQCQCSPAAHGDRRVVWLPINGRRAHRGHHRGADPVRAAGRGSRGGVGAAHRAHRCPRPPRAGLPAPVVAGGVCDAAAVWRGAFLAHGSLTEPGRSTLLHVDCPGPELAMALVGAARRLGVPQGTLPRSARHRATTAVMIGSWCTASNARNRHRCGEMPVWMTRPKP